MVDEVESEDQMEFEVAEDAAQPYDYIDYKNPKGEEPSEDMIFLAGAEYEPSTGIISVRNSSSLTATHRELEANGWKPISNTARRNPAGANQARRAGDKPYQLGEENAPDTGEAESTADEDAEAKEDAALAGEKEEEMNESFVSMLARLDRLSESKDDEDEDEDDDEDDGSHKLLGVAGKAKKSFGKEVEESRYPWLDHPDRPGAKKKKDDDGDKSSSNKKKVDEWANQAGKGPGKGTDASFEQDIEFMTKVIAGGLNKPKSTGQTTVPVIAGQEDRMHDNPNDWATLAGIKK
jgi:hypothetical protein